MSTDTVAAQIGVDLDGLAWMTGGLCAQTDPEAFFPEKGVSSAEAKSICTGCPVIAECLQYALEHGETGVWGGTSERQRRKMLREQAAGEEQSAA